MSALSEYLRFETALSELQWQIDGRSLGLRLFCHKDAVSIQFESISPGVIDVIDSRRGPYIRLASTCRPTSDGDAAHLASVLALKWFARAGRKLPQPLRVGFATEVGGLRLTHEAEWACWLVHVCGGTELSRQLFENSDVVVVAPIEASIRAVRLLELAARVDRSRWANCEVIAEDVCFSPGGYAIDIKSPESLNDTTLVALGELYEYELTACKQGKSALRRLVCDHVRSELCRVTISKQ